MLDLAELRHIIPDPLPTQHKDASASSNEITPEITPETRDFDLDGDENSVTSITAALSQQSELDDVDDPVTFTSAFEQITLQQLFNFSDDTWTKLMERIGMRSLDNKLEFYELVELSWLANGRPLALQTLGVTLINRQIELFHTFSTIHMQIYFVDLYPTSCNIASTNY
ncbi:hypothetical protein AZE42_11394 [Rhizopogon vesiculosus]|uniref:Uncharacterized protein n=1 Tax=Rhizopogon vesiculosus TaxID=180088 RepID=A0A1J8QFJ2_9AGAM|nr:hypothetical protein AZE42_11394 [Rhizopogon vesiculosus]